MRTEFENIQHKEDDANEGSLKVTAMMIRTVYVEIKKNIPFDTHASLVSLQEMHRIKMGFHHYEISGATKILESISDFMHSQLIRHMISKNLPFSIIIDGSTDSAENKFFIIYFQILN